jgi:hypothetical protein
MIMTIRLNGVLFAAFSLLSLALLTSGAPSGSQLPLKTRVLYQFEAPSWIENLAVRKNGEILATLLIPNASLYALSKPWSETPAIRLVHRFPTVQSLLGIAETKKEDRFVVVGGNFSAVGVGSPGTSAAWSVDFSRSSTHPTIKLLAEFPDAVFLNGVVSIPDCDTDDVLISDATLGLTFRLNVDTGKYSVAIKVPEMVPKSSAPALLGVNGIHYRKGYLYWTNSFYATVYRVKVGKDGVAAKGAQVETIATLNALFLDDFTFDSKGNIWVATNLDHRLFAISPKGKSTVVAGSPTELTISTDTACTFGRTGRDEDSLYVVTGGGLSAPINGTIIEGGKIVAVDTRGFKF